MFDYYMALLILIASLFAVSIANDFLHMHVFRHDALYYMSAMDYLHKVEMEGRWLNYLLFPVLKKMNGSFAAILSLFAFGYFFYSAAYAWSKHRGYALLIALLMVQIPSLYDLLTWPATAIPAFLSLALSVLLYKRINIFVFFTLFGVIFFATMSNYYYMLPILFLTKFSNETSNENLKFLFLRLVPAWAIGFIVGYLVSQWYIYAHFGHLMQIISWRHPHYIHSFHDLMENIRSSILYFEEHISIIFSHKYSAAFAFFVILVALWKSMNKMVIYSSLIFIAILIVHYIVILPVGLRVDLRTIVSTWVGVLGVLFFIPSIGKVRVAILAPIILVIISKLYIGNHNNLKWFYTLTDTYYSELTRVTPFPPKMYDGIVFYVDNSDIKKRNSEIAVAYNLKRDAYFETIDIFRYWVPFALEAGFATTTYCDGKMGINDFYDHSFNPNRVCSEIDGALGDGKIDILTKNSHNFFQVLGVYKNRLLVSFGDK
ncbi:Membrane protein, GtrA family [hydrothermal vent metagenome]|uniref:Membrane protein, GtrA family n=1 Tax=hydrothermal vent metagenome TaxID=652676 RepID=A0A1W1BQR8_9ZZZZ